MKWLLVFVFVSGQKEVLAEMSERDQKGEVQCWGLASAVNRVARDGTPGGKPDYKAVCEVKK